MEKNADNGNDFVFRYPLKIDEAGAGEPIYHDRLAEMFRVQFKNILDLAIPLYGEKEVKIDGFKLLSNDNRVYKIFKDLD